MKRLLLLAYTAYAFTANAQTYNVITYNIRYDNGHDGEDNWVNRKEKVASIIKDNVADIVGLQEVLHNQLNYLKGELKDYSYVGVGRNNGKTKGEYSPIFYKTNLFTLVDKGWFWLSETPAKPSKGWDAACPRICTWAVLKDNATNQQFIVLNTHLDHKGKEARKNSITAISDTIAALSIKHLYKDNSGETHYLPVFVTGDFNFTPTDEAYSRFAIGQRPRQDSYTAAAMPEGTVGTANAFKLDGTYTNRIDYVWVTDFTVDYYRVINDKLPNGHFPSDHFPVMVKLSLKQQ